MIIGIDISQIVYQTGVSRYTKELVRHLLKTDTRNTYKLFAGVLRQRNEIESYLSSLKKEGLTFKSFIVPIPPKVAGYLFNRGMSPPIEMFIGDVDVFHSSNWTQPRTRGKLVTTVHDLTPLYYPDYHEPYIVENFKKNLELITRYADHVITDSKATRNDLVNNTSIDERKISVVYLGVGHEFKPQDEKEIERVRQKYNLPSHYILSVGTKEPRKNVNRLIPAFTKAKLPDYSLVLTGKHGWGDIPQTTSNVIETGFVDDADLPGLYSGAVVFVYVSEYEGFGLPVAEAMSCGCPVITSNVSSLPEVGGKAAILVDPTSEGAIADAIRKVVGNNTSQTEMRKASIKQAEKFTWEKTAKETLAIYVSQI